MRTPGFWYRRRGFRATLLGPLGAAFALAGRVRRLRARPWRAPVPVICIGNLVVGGTGKTPVAMAVAQQLAERGIAAHFLTRGYGGRRPGPLQVDPARHSYLDVGDEPLLLATQGPAWVARDRAAGARAAIAAGAQALVMDDGFQNPSLVKDLSLVVIDGEAGFGNGRIVPAGPLRENPAAGLRRADAVVLMGEDRLGLGRRIAERGLPVLRARLKPVPDDGGLRGEAVVAFAGIGRPEKFFAAVEELGARLVAGFAYPDHHRFRPDELMQMVELAADAEAVLVTTAKDYARLPDAIRPAVRVVPAWIEWRDPAQLDSLLDRIAP